jgi:hypothetical protein
MNRAGCYALCLLAWINVAWADTPEIKAFLKQHCATCHNAETKEGGLDLAAVDTQFDQVASQAKWVRLHDRVVSGEMPPPEAEQPSAEARKSFVRVLSGQLHTAHAKLKGTVLRRLNRHEYERTLNSLLGTHVQVADMLPEDGRAHGFDNIGEALDLSPTQLQKYMEAAGLALDACVSFGPPPEVKKQSHTFDTGRNTENIGKAWVKRDDGAVVVATECCQAVKVHEVRIEKPGRYKVQVTTSAHRTEQPIVCRFHAGRDFFDSMPLHEVFEAQPGAAKVQAFEVLLRPNETVRLFPHFPKYWLKDEEIQTYTGPGLALHKLEVEGPFYESWPLPGHVLRFGDLTADDVGPKNQRDKPWYRPQYKIQSASPADDLARVLPPFLTAAFRRPVSSAIAAPFLALGQRELTEGASLEQALRTAQIAALCSPDFLFLREPAGKLDDYALASRLSYMLWGSPPDAKLLSLAQAGKLSQPSVLREQTERLLLDSRGAHFTRHFLGQWLNLREIDFTTPDKQLYPEYDPLLRYAMLGETEHFFTEMLQHNRSVLEFVDSDWTFLNERLAQHYGIEGVRGVDLRKVSLRPEHHRGGVLTHASVLKVSANGTTTSPVVRGAYVLQRILGIEPPPPPPGVPGVEPDIRGATTLREQLEKHRSNASCNSCHKVIDPPGFALESYDVMGGYREHYRSLGKDFPRPDPSLTNGKHVEWRVGPKVDASGQTPEGKSFANLEEYKRHLLAQPERFTTALAEKLATYASGRGLGFSDRPELQRIARTVAAQGYGLRDLVHTVVQSEIFRSK